MILFSSSFVARPVIIVENLDEIYDIPTKEYSMTLDKLNEIVPTCFITETRRIRPPIIIVT